jgi:hypothetical protein
VRAARSPWVSVQAMGRFGSIMRVDSMLEST